MPSGSVFVCVQYYICTCTVPLDEQDQREKLRSGPHGPEAPWNGCHTRSNKHAFWSSPMSGTDVQVHCGGRRREELSGVVVVVSYSLAHHPRRCCIVAGVAGCGHCGYCRRWASIVNWEDAATPTTGRSSQSTQESRPRVAFFPLSLFWGEGGGGFFFFFFFMESWLHKNF